jgi:hypothetical protein
VITESDLVCFECGRTPEQIEEYVDEAKYLNGIEGVETWTAAKFVMAEEGTLNQENGHFACTDCYIKIGMPSAPRGWVAP